MTEQLWCMKVVQDFTTAKEILSPTQFLLYKPKAKAIMSVLESRFPKKERLKLSNGFYVELSGTDEECKKEIKRLETFYYGDEINDEELKNYSNDRFIKTLGKKFKRFKTKLYNKAIKDNSPMMLFNQMGITVDWFRIDDV